MERIVVSKNVTVLSGDIFSNCTNLKEVIIPEGVTNINNVFNGSQITGTLTLPRSIKYVRPEVYSIVEGNIMVPCHIALNGNLRENCTYYHEGGVTDFDEDNCSLCVRTGSCGDDATYKMTLHGKTIISGRGEITYINYMIQDAITELIIENGIYSVGGSAFTRARRLKILEIADSVREIDWRAFSGCSELQTVKVGKNLKTNMSGIFEGAVSLKKSLFQRKIHILLW